MTEKPIIKVCSFLQFRILIGVEKIKQ
uniref:Uncharacterized protein n=1 Tax=Arundo donax TaxID=35708 RepID=A0A0A8Z1J1_ARUDO